MTDRLFPSLPADPQLLDLFRLFPDSVPPLLDYHDRLLRDASPLTVGDREMIAAYVSGLNSCNFCQGAHTIAAGVYGIEETVLAALMECVDTAPVDDRLKPILAYVKKLTQTPARITPADAERVYAGGWSERALFDAISVCALFNMMNRIVMGAGIESDPRLRSAPEIQARRRRMGSPGPDPHQAEPSYGKLAQWLEPNTPE
ncbi:peroxidase-related enzyme [Sphingomonas sp.]|uniref:carboxymuconolactone decarboxylase family protein n=1 Tax=Sphingomonas sp. TaxID=28214 RepID=UPI001831C2A0|nr:peroxidase-related enzyme [Sphingomonas sp.]MBA3511123.1 peroxidase-related enzyme [Sphingomonas sp.]